MIANAYYNKAVAIVTSDLVDFANPQAPTRCCDAIYIGGAGVVVVVLEDSVTASFTCVAAQILPIKARRVNATSTTATLLLALYTI